MPPVLRPVCHRHCRKQAAEWRRHEYSLPTCGKIYQHQWRGTESRHDVRFPRMKGCNLSCSYCDTSWANTPDCPCEMLSADALIRWLKESGTANVTLTGGEPLLIPDIASLIEQIGAAGFAVEIETNGSRIPGPVLRSFHRPAFTMDYKCPDSGMEEFMDLDNFALLEEQDSVKFVVSSEKDLDRAAEITRKYSLSQRCRRLFKRCVWTHRATVDH